MFTIGYDTPPSQVKELRNMNPTSYILRIKKSEQKMTKLHAFLAKYALQQY